MALAIDPNNAGYVIAGGAFHLRWSSMEGVTNSWTEATVSPNNVLSSTLITDIQFVEGSLGATSPFAWAATADTTAYPVDMQG